MKLSEGERVWLVPLLSKCIRPAVTVAAAQSRSHGSHTLPPCNLSLLHGPLPSSPLPVQGLISVRSLGFRYSSSTHDLLSSSSSPTALPLAGLCCHNLFPALCLLCSVPLFPQQLSSPCVVPFLVIWPMPTPTYAYTTKAFTARVCI